jgi:nitroreductase
MNRRSFLKDAAAVTIMIANGEVWRAFGQTPPVYGEGPAFEPWKTWRQDAKEGPLVLVRAAIICSNAYNSQPWLFKVTKSKIKIYADIKRNLGAFDPYLREMHFSLGCALENLLLAAVANGYKASLRLEPGKLEPAPALPEPVLIGRVGLAPGKTVASELFDAIPRRHTNRKPFDPQKPLPPGFVEAVERLSGDDQEVKLFLFTAEAERKKIAEIIVNSSQFVLDPEVQKGTAPWRRTTLEELQKYRDGTYLGPGGPFRPSTPEQYRSLILSGPLLGLIAVRDRYNREQTVRAGRVWQRAHLKATTYGVAARPANGAVEIIDHEKRLNQKPKTLALLAEVTGDAAWQPTFMFYMGYPTAPADNSPRRDVKDVVV